MQRIVIGLLLILSTQSYGAEYSFPLMPNPKTSPGGLCSTSDGHFTGYRYTIKIPVCRRHVTDGMKNQIYNDYGIPENCRRSYTIDHIIPLSIGGSNRYENLWPEHRAVKATRLQFEDEIHLMMEAGKINQPDAVALTRRVKFNPAIQPGKNKGSCN
ncbi:MAG: HNH endonuclease signature motif containing protein [Bdellovibrionia bacterium]